MQERATYTYQKMNQDVSKSKHSNTFYWEGNNIRVITNEEFGTVTNQKGNELVLSIPILTVNPTNKLLSAVTFPIINVKIIHSEIITDKKVVLFTTNEEVDCVWVMEETSSNFYEINLAYIDELGFTYESQIESVGIKENNEAEKVYWVDGENEVRVINILDPSLLNKSPSEITITPSVIEKNPQIIGYGSGGAHQAGMIQYTYNLYYKYGAQTKVSPLSKLVALNNDLKGSPLDSPVSKSPIILIDEIDQKFDYIRVYSIFYSSLDQIPRISLIYENENNSDTLQITDSNVIISEIAQSEFNIIATQNIIPKHILNKDGHLFYANYKTNKFDVDYDARAYSFTRLYLGTIGQYRWTTTVKHHNSTYQDYNVFHSTGLNDMPPANTISLQDFYNAIEDEHDAIIDDPSAVYRLGEVQYLPDDVARNAIGGIGPNVEYWVRYKQKSLNTIFESNSDTSLKRGERYRVALVFKNNNGEESFAKWIADLKIPAANEKEYLNLINSSNEAELAYIEVKVNNMPAEAVSYRLVIVERKEYDKTVKGQGLVNPCVFQQNDYKDIAIFPVGSNLEKLYSIPLTRTFRVDPNTTNPINPILDGPTGASYPDTYRGEKFQKPQAFNRNSAAGTIYPDRGDIIPEIDSAGTYIGNAYASKIHFNIISPEFIFNQSKLAVGDDYKIRVVGFQKNTNSYSKADFYTAYSSASNNKDEPVELRKSYELDAKNAEVFQYTVDDPVQNDSDANVDRWFKNEGGGGYFLLGDIRNDFERASDSVRLNRYEFKKVFYKRKFGSVLLHSSRNGFEVSNLSTDKTVAFIPPIEADVSVQTKEGEDFDADPQILIDTTVIYTPLVDMDFETKFTYYSGSQLFFTSEDLWDNSLALWEDVSTPDDDYALIVEFYNDDIPQYGGNTYADRQRNVYVPYSELELVSVSNINGKFGDTFIQESPLLRIFENNAGSSEVEATISEIVDFVCESSVNSNMRYDILESKNTGEALDENNAYGYNSVYEQQNIINKAISKPFNFTSQNVFSDEIIASPIKLLGEQIDNWTSISVNDKITLETEHGEITGLVKLRNVMFAFQRSAVSYLSINPRVQLSTSDNVPILLGSGELLQRYDYISTNSGTLHPKSITSVESGVFYFDILNNSINRIASQNEEISLTKGLYNYTKEYTNNNYNNLLKGVEGVSTLNFNNVVSYYDNRFKDIYFSFLTDDDSFTVSYNLIADGFTSFYDFKPYIYFNINSKMFTANHGQFTDDIWEHDKGFYNTFYDVYYSSKIKLLMNDKPSSDKIIDNINYITDTKLISDNVDKFNITFNNIKVDTSYQTSGNKELIYGSNVRRKFREFNITLPREESTRNRIRAPWALIELEFNHSEEDYKFTLYDITFSYTIN